MSSDLHLIPCHDIIFWFDKIVDSVEGYLQISPDFFHGTRKSEVFIHSLRHIWFRWLQIIRKKKRESNTHKSKDQSLYESETHIVHEPYKEGDNSARESQSETVESRRQSFYDQKHDTSTDPEEKYTHM